MKTVYLLRHSEPLKPEMIYNEDTLQIQNEKYPLTINGEEIAKTTSKNKELYDLNAVYSSNYTRAMATAKYIALENNTNVKVISDFHERTMGINSWDELPLNYNLKQFEDIDYKIGFGESIREVKERMYNALMNVLKSEDDKIAIVSHATAITALLLTWCECDINNYSMKFNGKEFFDGNWNYCQTFKLTFDNENLINIENLDNEKT